MLPILMLLLVQAPNVTEAPRAAALMTADELDREIDATEASQPTFRLPGGLLGGGGAVLGVWWVMSAVSERNARLTLNPGCRYGICFEGDKTWTSIDYVVTAIGGALLVAGLVVLVIELAIKASSTRRIEELTEARKALEWRQRPGRNPLEERLREDDERYGRPRTQSEGPLVPLEMRFTIARF